jgi:hypothetical protein
MVWSEKMFSSEVAFEDRLVRVRVFLEETCLLSNNLTIKGGQFARDAHSSWDIGGVNGGVL